MSGPGPAGEQVARPAVNGQLTEPEPAVPVRRGWRASSGLWLAS
jgi:hypothetical protein